jgi:hypothetical protein
MHCDGLASQPEAPSCNLRFRSYRTSIQNELHVLESVCLTDLVSRGPAPQRLFRNRRSATAALCTIDVEQLDSPFLRNPEFGQVCLGDHLAVCFQSMDFWRTRVGRDVNCMEIG